MDVNFIEVLLLAVFTFIFAIDQFSLTELIYRPIIACPIIGLILGDLKTGLVVGGTYELMMVGNLPVGGAQPPNAVLGGVVGVVLSVKTGFKVDEALGASIIFAVFGQYVVTATFAFMSAVMSKADKSAEEGRPEAIAHVNYISMFILGSLFTVLSLIAYFSGIHAKGALEAFKENFSWVMVGLGVSGGMMRYVGFAILMKIMLAKDMWGIYFAGFAAAALFGNIQATSGGALLLVAFIGVAIALYDYNISVKIKNAKGNGGSTDGI